MKYFSYIFLATLLSCALNSQQNDKGINTVEVPLQQKKVLIDKDNHTYHSSYGPVEIIQDNSKNSVMVVREPVVGIHLAPAAYHVAGYISLFRSLEEHKIKISALSGEGISAIVAALYAKYQDSNRVEWKLYALFGNLKDVYPFTKEWKQRIALFLEEEFQDQKLHQLKALLLVPLISNHEIVVRSNALVVTTLMSSLNITGADSKSITQSSLLSTQVNFKRYLEDFAKTDIIFQVSILPETFKLSGNSGFLLGIYSKKFYQLAKQGSLFYQLDYLLTPVDEIPNIGEAMARTKKSSDNLAMLIFNKIQMWKTKNNN